MSYKKEDILYHLEKISVDPSHINDIQDMEMFNLISTSLENGELADVQKKENTKQKNAMAQTKYQEHFKQFDDNTKVHNNQYKNKR